VAIIVRTVALNTTPYRHRDQTCEAIALENGIGTRGDFNAYLLVNLGEKHHMLKEAQCGLAILTKTYCSIPRIPSISQAWTYSSKRSVTSSDWTSTRSR
jgi:hypothetical protein